MQAPRQAKNDAYAVQAETSSTTRQRQNLVDKRPTAVAQRKLAEMMNNSPRVLQQRALSDAIHNSPRMVAQREEKPNNTGLPDQLKSGIESLSGMSMDHVKVHYNSDKPAQLQAHAYAQGSEIHLGAGQEKHLPHEAWHVVQQAQGRVKPTLQMKSVAVNDDPAMEKEADMMGEMAISHGTVNDVTQRRNDPDLISSTSCNDAAIQLRNNESVVQLKMDWDKVVKTLMDVFEKHGQVALYKEMWRNGEARRISEEVGSMADTDKDNVRRRLVSHDDIVPLLMPHRMKLESKNGAASLEDLALGEHDGTGDEDSYTEKDIVDVYTAFRSLLFFHASVAASAVKESGLDPNFGGKEGGLTDTNSLRAKRETNLAAAKKKVFVSRKFTETKQYADGDEKNIVMLIVPRVFQGDLQLDPDSQYGIKGGDELKGAVKENGYPNYWGYLYLLNELSGESAKKHFSSIWDLLIKRGLIKH